MSTVADAPLPTRVHVGQTRELEPALGNCNAAARAEYCVIVMQVFVVTSSREEGVVRPLAAALARRPRSRMSAIGNPKAAVGAGGGRVDQPTET